MELLKIIVWPAAVVLIVTVCSLIFRNPICRKIEQIRKFKTKDTEIGFEKRMADLQQKESGPTASSVIQLETNIENKSSPDAAFTIEPSDVRVEFEKEKSALTNSHTTKALGEEIKKSLRPVTYHFSKEQIIELGILQLARVVMFTDFWRIFNYIFGSQIEFLRLANAQAITEADAVQFFQNLIANFQEHPFKDKHTKDYLDFLFTTQLLNEEKTPAHTIYSITEKGNEFLQWCVTNKLPLNKPF